MVRRLIVVLATIAETIAAVGCIDSISARATWYSHTASVAVSACSNDCTVFPLYIYRETRHVIKVILQKHTMVAGNVDRRAVQRLGVDSVLQS